MVRVLALIVALSASSLAFAQPAVRTTRVWNVAWRDVAAPNGTVTRVPVFYWAESETPKAGERYSAPREIETVVYLEDQLRTAQRANDAAALDRILSEQFFETDVDGLGRNKGAILQLARRGESSSTSLSSMTARASDNAVVLAGEEEGGTPQRRLFTHVYVRESDGAWKLLSSTTVASAR